LGLRLSLGVYFKNFGTAFETAVCFTTDAAKMYLNPGFSALQ
jgi:hypothetical protein